MRELREYCGIKIISKVKAAGKSTYEDALRIFYTQGQGWPSIAIFDGRRAWQESGDSERMLTDHSAESTGQLAADSAAHIIAEQVSIGGPAYGLKEINRLWGEALKNYGYDLSKPEGLPGCAATVATINPKERWLTFAHLCDTKIICFDTKGNYFIPTVDQMDLWDRKVFRLTVENATKLKVSPRTAMWEIDYDKFPNLTDPKSLDHKHRMLENMVVAAGIGVLNGMAMTSMDKFMQTGSFPIGGYEYILICTDGLSFPCGVDKPVPWQEMIHYLLKHKLSLNTLASEIRDRESSDTEFVRFPRFAYHRDATGVLIKV